MNLIFHVFGPNPPRPDRLSFNNGNNNIVHDEQTSVCDGTIKKKPREKKKVIC